MKVCAIAGCGKKLLARGWCVTHYTRWRERGDVNYQPWVRKDGAGGINNGYVRLGAGRERQEYEHIVVAERALGRPLPPKARVHHVDEDRTNNTPSNLVICPSDAYHLLLHQRMRARDACGHADWLKCRFCKVYDEPTNLLINSGGNCHRSCQSEYNRDYQVRRKAA